LAIASGATFIARTMDRDPHHLTEMLKQFCQKVQKYF